MNPMDTQARVAPWGAQARLEEQKQGYPLPRNRVPQPGVLPQSQPLPAQATPPTQAAPAAPSTGMSIPDLGTPVPQGANDPKKFWVQLYAQYPQEFEKDPALVDFLREITK